MPTRTDEAFVLTRYAFRERDLVVVALTRRSGQVRFVARRARGTRNASGTSLEPLSQVTIEYFESPRSELATLREAAVIRGSYDLAAMPEAWAAGQVVAELALIYCPPGQRQEAAYRLVDRCLHALSAQGDPITVAAYAELWFLRLGGVFPELDRCGVCGSALTSGVRRLDPRESVFVCERHGSVGGGNRVGEGAVAWLERASREPVERLETRPDTDVLAVLAALRTRFAEREVASWRYLLSLTRC